MILADLLVVPPGLAEAEGLVDKAGLIGYGCLGMKLVKALEDHTESIAMKAASRGITIIWARTATIGEVTYWAHSLTALPELPSLNSHEALLSWCGEHEAVASREASPHPLPWTGRHVLLPSIATPETTMVLEAPLLVSRGSFSSDASSFGSCRSDAHLLLDLLSMGDPRFLRALTLCFDAALALRAASLSERIPDFKEGNHQDMLTWWDTATETTISQGILAQFPEDHFIGEEASSTREWLGESLPSGHVWILDPIDGTANFAHSHRDYAISLACIRNGTLCFGIVIDCAAGLVYTGVTEKGAFLNGRRLPWRGDRESRPKELIIDLSMNVIELLRTEGCSMKALASSIAGHRASGCASLSLCHIAEGTLDAYFSSRLGIWDWAAAAVLLFECGAAMWTGIPRGPGGTLRDKGFFLGAGTEQIAIDLYKAMGKNGIPGNLGRIGSQPVLAWPSAGQDPA